MNIDEFIEHTKEKAEEYKYRASFFESDNPMNKAYIKVAKDHEQLAEWLEKSKEYQQLEEQGRLIKLPCKVGDVVYEINTDRNIVSALKIISTKIYSYAIYFDYQLIDGIYKNIVSFADIDIGKTVFLTQSAAEEKLKELRGGENESSN